MATGSPRRKPRYSAADRVIVVRLEALERWKARIVAAAERLAWVGAAFVVRHCWP